MFLFRLASQEGMPSQDGPWKCPQCSVVCKSQLTLVRHLGTKHKMVKQFLREDGYVPGLNGSQTSQAIQGIQDTSTSQESIHMQPPSQLTSQQVVHQQQLVNNVPQQFPLQFN